MIVLMIVNAVIALGTIGFALATAAKPALLSRSTEPLAGEQLFTRMYAARAIPIGLAAAIVPFVGTEPLTLIVLLIAAIAQLGDVVVGLAAKNWGMSGGAVIAAVVHLCTLAFA